ncbi:crotonase/enoyl-CoA hydratase family protein [Pseudaestuariivita rosea]|uniref:crotonase/enoyl-CoA hydratase family protein n=1 Tax=Pseudaestuariivita rosea TaxID=2763263 RepID=UPI001ABBD73B|nr:crotonase/enoyl-CoA hydratase family protein [Pseudaestuariivita rosea]
MSFQTIKVQTDARGVATLTLARPDKHNAMSAQMIADLTQAAGDLGADPAVRVVVLTGQGKSFCAGGDLAWMQAQMAADAETRFTEARKLALMLKALNDMPKPLIGRLQGNAFGGGVGLAAVCDIAIGGSGLKMGLTEVRLGLIPATIGPYVVARMGAANARRVMLSGRLFEADEAAAMGLLARVSDDLDAAVEAEIEAHLHALPGAVADTKALIARLGPVVDHAVIDDTIHALVQRWDSDEAKTEVSAFLSKRHAK